ncbi:YlxR family protein [Rhodococcus sp. SGAir0479]|uniref:YlxR family protein n=1 Tax=Rhodococcus sp. SGAir0479 TaxID=2567884 RepID=UPI0010CD155E|nr:YlxR family protein [Rhodococcus sp. SGAir0479]QCQ90725.1 YlxR family protein [Rhodococcus sp. SGAir0479]
MVQRELSLSTRARAGEPVRTCVGCRQKGLATDLLRVVAQEGESGGFLLRPDPKRRLPGRGAWLHPDPKCLSEAGRRRAFGRALRVSGSLDSSELDRLIGAGESAETSRAGHSNL